MLLPCLTVTSWFVLTTALLSETTDYFESDCPPNHYETPLGCMRCIHLDNKCWNATQCCKNMSCPDGFCRCHEYSEQFACKIPPLYESLASFLFMIFVMIVGCVGLIAISYYTYIIDDGPRRAKEASLPNQRRRIPLSYATKHVVQNLLRSSSKIFVLKDLVNQTPKSGIQLLQPTAIFYTETDI